MAAKYPSPLTVRFRTAIEWAKIVGYSDKKILACFKLAKDLAHDRDDEVKTCG